MGNMLTDRMRVVGRGFFRWFWGSLVFLALALFMMAKGMPPIILVFPWVGLFFHKGYEITNELKNIAGAPFSFCLPGYRQSLRKLSLRAALYVGVGVGPLGLAVWWLLQRAPGEEMIWIDGCLHLVAAFLGGAAISFCLGDPRFVLSRIQWGIVLLLSIPLVLVGILIVPALMQNPPIGIPLFAAVCVFFWIRLGDMSRVKSGHRRILEDALERQAQVGITKTASPWVENAFQRVMEPRARSATARSIGGSFYRAFGLVFSYWIWLAMSIVAGSVVLGYAAPWFAKTVFLALGLLSVHVHLPMTFDEMLLPISQRQRRHATIAVAVAVSLLLVGAAGLVTACTWVFSLFLPALDGSIYAGLDPRSIFLSCLLVPWVLGCRLLQYTHPRIANTITSAAVISVIAAMWLLGVARISWLRPAETILLAVAWIGGWPFFLLALRDVCTGASLIEPDPSGVDTE